VTELHGMHRTMYIGEKHAYYERAQEAVQMPGSAMSLISDGMCQNHSKCPWLGNLKDFPACITQHLQGVLEHGREMTIYRTFNNVASDSNLAIHCFLLQLEARIKVHGEN
jgi:hypothetical protein